MKLAIVTIIDMINYGNRLQNFAMQEVLKDIAGCEPDTLVVTGLKRDITNLYKRIGYIICPSVICKMRPHILREIPFNKFSKNKIKQRKIHTLNGKAPCRLSKEYSYFILGSDQIWNPEFMNLDVPNGGVYNRFLSFADKRQRIAVSPSFGVYSIDESRREEYRVGLDGFEYLSSREEAGAAVISELTGRKAPVLLDPTMVLDADEWRKFEKPANVDVSKPYILKYVLGMQSEEYRTKIESIAKENGLEVYELMEDERLLTATPDQFVFLIEHATLVCTDSFHATVFSILFDRPFLLHKREDTLGSMNSRLETLLKTLKLENKLDSEEVDLNGTDYSQAHKVIENEKIKFKEYIRQALKEENHDRA